MIIKQSDFHSNPFRCFRHTPSRKSPLLRVILLRPELRPLIIIIPMSHPFVMRLIIHMFHTSVMPYISLDLYSNPKLYTIPNMQNMRYFCCSVYVPSYNILVSIANLGNKCSNESALVLEHSLLALNKVGMQLNVQDKTYYSSSPKSPAHARIKNDFTRKSMVRMHLRIPL